MSASRDLDLTLAAQDDIADLLDASANTFGPISRRRYEVLIKAALDDIRDNPLRLGSLDRAEFGKGVRSYHLRHSHIRARMIEGMVRRPRHLLIYKQPDPRLVLVLRVLHDSMDLARHLPPADQHDQGD